MRLRRLDHSLDHVRAVERLRVQVDPPDLELVGEQDLVDDRGQPVGLVDDERDEPRTAGVVEREVVAAQRLGGAVHGRQRCAQLVRRGRDELRLELVEPVLLGDVPQRVDRAAEELHAGDRDPALAAPGVQRQRRGAHWLAGGPERNPCGQLVPVRDRIRGRRAARCLGGDTGDRCRRRVPETDHPGPVDEEDALADMGEHLVRIRASLDLDVQARVVDRERDHPRKRAAPRKIGAFVRSNALAGQERERSQRPPPAGGER